MTRLPACRKAGKAPLGRCVCPCEAFHISCGLASVAAYLVAADVAWQSPLLSTRWPFSVVRNAPLAPAGSPLTV